LKLPCDIGILASVEVNPMNHGEKVIVTAYGGKRLVRRVVADQGQTIVVCNQNEYTQAEAEGRKPEGIGFPRECVKAAD
jgi:hypothetical protein